LNRKKTKVIKIGDVRIGGNNSISIQSMCNTNTCDVASTIEQIKNLERIGCQIVRLAIPDTSSALVIPKIKKEINIPIVADIHFDYRLALMAMKNGADGLRLNPGNIGSKEKVEKISQMAKGEGIPIRIGVNGGSLDSQKIKKYGYTAKAIVESALEHVNILEKCSFYDIKISVKSSSVPLTIESYKLLSNKIDYPLHLGITEAGDKFSGVIKSSIGIGSLLAQGIGDTIRVSLTASPMEEVMVGKEILKSLGLRDGLQIISCPTCGRTKIDIITLAREVKKRLINFEDKNLSVAVMGCVVNGPQEAKNADFGIAGGKGEGLIFKKGKPIKKVAESNLLNEFIEIIKKEHIKRPLQN